MDPTPPALPATPAPPPAPVAPRKSAGLFFLALVLLLLPGLVAQALSRAGGLVWTEVFVFLLPPVVAAVGSNLRPAPLLGLDRPRARHVVLGALVGAAGFLVANGVMLLWARVLPQWVLRAFDVSKVFDAPLAERVTIALVASVVAPVCEEVAFRGYIQRVLALRARAGAAIGASAVLFGLMHFDPVRLPALVLLGAVFGWLAWRAGSTWPAVAAHAMNNGLASGLVLAAGTPDAPAEQVPVVAVLQWLVFGMVSLGLLLRAFRTTTTPAPATDAIARIDPTDQSTRFSVARVPPRLWAFAAAGVALLLAMLAARVARGGS
ncbi:CPBP family intramembrane glutamic endopeptidase [Anaeromyxobacter oryzae]|uniref:CAAX prenyl protease 2/Lysostaphin resistance protein A-like domain-containing protein n=1 Tax=Anaeromyxobacter oryzae TaxID=2918170 RepID=A0ABM7WQ61_9BACT|nr:CPBP family intramembrane glutamic endopeptidase [Anaeromyxobacter oryzae]BDG01604.1 hypothetical protein AMOR_06000 [Anaeromyxobacter oryzae]